MLQELHLSDWRATKDTLHLYCQVVGKVRLATTAPRNHWWNAPLYLDVRGLTTRSVHHAGTTFDITLDFVDHAVAIRTADGRTEGFDLHDGLDVAEFDPRLHANLAGVGINVEIREVPFGVPMTTPFPSDHEHAAWDRDYVERVLARPRLDGPRAGGVQRLIQGQSSRGATCARGPQTPQHTAANER